MIQIEIIQEHGNLGFVGFNVDGHAGYAPMGQDIVCAAVSTLVQGTIIGLTDVAALETEYDLSDGHITCMVKPKDDREYDDADLLIRTMHSVLIGLEKQYKDYIKVFTSAM